MIHEQMNARTYNRTWEEIETMLEQATERQQDWINIYHESKKTNDRKLMMDAARNKKALEGVIKTLQWVIGEEGITNPLH